MRRALRLAWAALLLLAATAEAADPPVAAIDQRSVWPTGFQRELARAVLPGVKLTDLPLGLALEALGTGAVDMVAAPLEVTADRAERMLFTEPYMTGSLGLVTLPSRQPRGRVAVAANSVAEAWARTAPDLALWAVPSEAEAIRMVRSGRVEAALIELPVVPLGLTVAREIPGAVGFALALKDEALRAEVEKRLEEAKASGDIARLIRRWFGRPPAEKTAAMTVFEGVGTPGFPGYRPP